MEFRIPEPTIVNHSLDLSPEQLDTILSALDDYAQNNPSIAGETITLLESLRSFRGMSAIEVSADYSEADYFSYLAK